MNGKESKKINGCDDNSKLTNNPVKGEKENGFISLFINSLTL